MTRTALPVLAFGSLAAGVGEWLCAGKTALDLSNVGFTLAAAFAFAASIAARRWCSETDRRLWTSLAVATGAWFSGQLAWDWYSSFDRTVPTPSAADVLWLAFPLIASVGVYRFAPAPPRVRRILDLDAVALAIGVGGLTVALNWHALEGSHLGVTGRATTVAYPVTYAMVVAVGASAMIGAPEVLKRRDLMLVYAGLVCEGFGFGLWCPEVLGGTYKQGASALDAMWIAGLVLIGLGAIAARDNAALSVYAPDRLRRRTVVPALTFAALAATAVVGVVTHAETAPQVTTFAAIAVLGLLLIVRNWLAFAAVESMEAERHTALGRRNRELEAFAYSASHDLKAPLVSIDGFATMLERSLDARLDETERYYLRRIHANADGLQQLIADLFAFARSGGDERSADPVDTTALASELVEEWRERAVAKGINLELDGPLPTVRAHPVRLKQALTNLVDNALRYGGGDVRVSGRMTAEAAEILVEDAGAGVPAHERERIFDVFARGEGARATAPDGTGLGLALVKRIVESSGGNVRYEQSQGARFVLSFPKAAG